MPIWDYRCPICGRVKEDQQRPPLCDHCDHPDSGQPALMEKLPAAASFIIKGYSAKSGYSRKD